MEEKGIVIWGRLNPPTKGHRKLIEKCLEVSKNYNISLAYLFVTQTETKITEIKKAREIFHTTKDLEKVAQIIKNPLKWEEKLYFLKKIYNNFSNLYPLKVAEFPEVNTVVKMLDKMREYTDELFLIFGKDRVEEFENILNSYQNKTTTPFEVLKIFPVDRSEDDISATKVRLSVLKNDFEEFSKYIDTNNESVKKELFDLLKTRFEEFLF